MADIGSNALQATLERCEPIEISRTHVDVGGRGHDLGAVSTALTPADVARRPLGAIWQVGRTRYVIKARPEASTELAFNIAAGTEKYPEKCAACLTPASRALVFETTGSALPGGRGRSQVQVGVLKSLAARVNPAYGRELTRPVTAGNVWRAWHPVPFCDAHDERSRAVGFGTTEFNNDLWIAFRNAQYGEEFGQLNGVAGKGFVRRWWLALLLVALVLIAGGVAGTLASFGIGTSSSDIAGLVIGLPLLGVGIFLATITVRTLLTSRRPRATKPSS